MRLPRTTISAIPIAGTKTEFQSIDRFMGLSKLPLCLPDTAGGHTHCSHVKADHFGSSKPNRTAPWGEPFCSLRPTHTLDCRISFSGVQAVRINAPIAYILLYAALYAAFGVASPFWPRFFETRALTPSRLGLCSLPRC